MKEKEDFMKIWKDNPVCKDLFKIINANQDKRIYLYGAGTNGKHFQSCLEIMEIAIAGYVDSDEKKWNTCYREIPIISPYDLVYQKDFIVLVTVTDKYKDSVFKLLNSFGLSKDVDYYVPGNWWGCRYSNLIDPFLGFSRSDSIPGFHITGNPNANKKMAILGSSTSDWSTSGIRGWVDYFEGICDNKYEIYNGAISGYFSGQEMLKFIRDVVPLTVDTLIVLSGLNDSMETSKNPQYPLVSAYVDRNFKLISQECYSKGLESNGNSAQSWIMNMKMIFSICQMLEIKCYLFLEPSYGIAEYRDDYMEEFVEKYFRYDNGMKKKKEFYESVCEQIKEIDFIVDLTKIFDKENEQIYYDHCHCNEYGNAIIAREIYRYMNQK